MDINVKFLKIKPKIKAKSSLLITRDLPDVALVRFFQAQFLFDIQTVTVNEKLVSILNLSNFLFYSDGVKDSQSAYSKKVWSKWWHFCHGKKPLLRTALPDNWHSSRVLMKYYKHIILQEGVPSPYRLTRILLFCTSLRRKSPPLLRTVQKYCFVKNWLKIIIA